MSEFENTKIEEVKAVKEETTADSGCGVYKLKKPVMINGELVTEMEYDLESMDGNDIALAIKTLAKNNIIVTVAEMDQNYHAALFAIASGVAYEDVKRLGIKDFTKVCSLVRDFFLEE